VTETVAAETPPALAAGRPRTWLRRFNRGLAALLLVLSLIGLIEFAYAFIDDPAGRTDFLDFAAFYVGGSVLNSDRPQLYDPEAAAAATEAIGFTTRTTPYVYPPFLAVLFRPVAHAPYGTVRLAWTALNVIWLGLSAGLLLRLLRKPRQWAHIAAVWALAFLFPPVAFNILVFGQVNVALLWLLLAATIFSEPAATERQQAWAGAALGLAAGVKLFPALLIPYFWLRRSRRAAVAALLALGATVAIGIGGGGWQNTADYFGREMWRLQQQPPSLFWINNSAVATVQRLFVPYEFGFESYWMSGPVTFNVTPLADDPALGASLAQAAALLILAISAATLLADWLVRRKRPAAEPDLALGLLVVALLLLIALSWTSTHALMLLPMALLLAHAGRRPGAEEPLLTVLLLVWALYLAQRMWPYLGFWTSRPPYWTVTFGFLGALLLWLALYAMIWRRLRRPAAGSVPTRTSLPHNPE
jgi:hypothetical protein